ncbi:MAG: hypothetical protein JW776_10555 [Candidatus Lokiarchaeota archaeon]|nr:hypothetical protein [Candidatus Lokiarchaeota archaeon]
MEVKIDYETELLEDEIQKIKWIIDEFDTQFGDKYGKLNDEDIIRGMEFLDFMMSTVETENPKVATFLRNNLERLEKRYPIFFN